MLCIITVVHNRAEISSRFTQLLAAQSFKNFHLILVDDGSSDQTQTSCRNNLPKENLSILKGSGNLFWGGGLHMAYRHLKNQINREFEQVLICNDDIIFNTTFLDDLLTEFRALPEKHLLHAMQHFPEDDSYIRGYKLKWEPSGMKSFINPDISNVFPTRALLINFHDFINSSGFYPRILKHYRSDWEFTHRLFRRGYTLAASKKTVIDVPLNKKPHFEESNIQSLEDFIKVKWSLRSNTNVRSEIIFNLLCAPWKYKALYTFRTIYRFSAAFLLYTFRRIKA